MSTLCDEIQRLQEQAIREYNIAYARLDHLLANGIRSGPERDALYDQLKFWGDYSSQLQIGSLINGCSG